MGQLAAALEVAFEALPFVVRILGEQSRFLREPLQSIVRLLSAARGWLEESCRLQQHCVFILSGNRGSGKTRLLTAIAETLLVSGKHVGGILAPVVMDGDSRLGYDVLDLQSGNHVPLCRRDIEPTGGSIGPFHFALEGIRFGADALARAASSSTDLIILDEVGPLEFKGEGWGPSLDHLLSSFHGSLLLVVRPNLVRRAIERWSVSPLRIWNVRDVDKDSLTRELLNLISRRRTMKRENTETL
jgi:nucleoside-triphosphatase